MIKVKNSEIVNSTVSLRQILAKEIEIDVSFELSVVAKKLDELLTTYNESFKKLQNKYADKDDNGEMVTKEDEKTKQITISVSPENSVKLNEDIKKLQDVENTLSDVNPININRFKDVKVAPSVLMNISYLFTKDK